MILRSNNKNWTKFIDKLVLDNCLILGQIPKLTNKKFTKYIFATRHSLEIFKLYELRYLLLKVYPLIYSLFHRKRRNHDYMDKFRPSKEQKKKQQDLYRKINPYTIYRIKRDRFYATQIYKNIPPQILFASITPAYAQIIESAAKVCQMPWHQNRWLSGAITAAISYLTDEQKWNFYFDSIHKRIRSTYTTIYSKNKENIESIKEKTKFYAHSRWPSLIVIPDVANNPMIVTETKKVGIPVIGLVNSACQLNIDYPIFAQDTSLHSVHFFCHFLATLIAKEIIQIQHKLFAARKPGFFKRGRIQWKKINTLTNTKPILFSLQRFVVIKRTGLKASIKRNIHNHLLYEDELITLADLVKQKRKWQQKISFFKERKYLFAIFNIAVERGGLGASISTKTLIDFEQQKKSMLTKKKLYWTDNEQKKAFVRSQTSFTHFEKFLEVQWVKKGRLRYNNFNKDYYWKALILTAESHYRYNINRMFKLKREATFPTTDPWKYKRYLWYQRLDRTKKVNKHLRIQFKKYLKFNAQF
jgi:ribosomal protein S2